MDKFKQLIKNDRYPVALAAVILLIVFIVFMVLTEPSYTPDKTLKDDPRNMPSDLQGNCGPGGVAC